jgi:DNA-binding response OmpR family regulator
VGKEESGRESEDFSRSGFKVVLMFRQHDKRESLAICLEEQGFEVTAFSSPLAGLFHLDRCFVDVVVWEWSGSRESHEAGAFPFDVGDNHENDIFDLVGEIRNSTGKACFVLVTEDELNKRKTHFVGEGKFDECFLKELPPKELAYWIGQSASIPKTLDLYPFVLRYENREIECYGQELPLTFSEFVFFRMLLENAGRSVPFEDLAEALYPDENVRKSLDVKEGLRQRAYQIRNKIESLGCERKWLRNLRTRGYRLDIPKK